MSSLDDLEDFDLSALELLLRACQDTLTLVEGIDLVLSVIILLVLGLTPTVSIIIHRVAYNG